MLAGSISFSAAVLIIFAGVSIVNGKTEEQKCEEQTSFTVLADVQKLTTNLYYDASKDLETDMGFIWAMCYAFDTFTTETFNFFVGARVKKGNNGIECPHKDENNKDCKDDIEHACASKLIPKQFNDFVCCTNVGKPAPQCLCELDESKKNEFDQCVALNHPQIKPDQVLLDNANLAKTADPEGKTFPVLTFNGKIADSCARYMFYNYPIKTVCILLANCN